MPEVDGFEILNLLHQRHSASRILILSGQEDYRPMAGRMAEGFSLKIAATVSKPFRFKEFRQILEAIKLSLPPRIIHSNSGTAA
jgi:DNA-binding NarL/FixJ family response regulator